MSYQHRQLNLTYEPSQGWAHFVLYTEPMSGLAGSALNAAVRIESETPPVREWLDRLTPCEPNALHTTLVAPRKIPNLFYPCVYDDKDSPSAVSGDGCTCYQTSIDPEFGLPVIAQHYRTVTGNIEKWTYLTYAPLSLRPGDQFASLIIDRHHFWIRTASGTLSLLPEQEGRGYNVGYRGSGPHEFAQYIQRLLASEGQETAARSQGDEHVDPHILSWAQSADAKRRRVLTLDDLRQIQQSALLFG